MPGKRPAFLWYSGDWLRDPGVRCVSFAARGLWTDMLSLMFECDRKGFLSVNGKPVTAEQLARMTGGSTDEVSRLLTELESSGVFSRTEHGIIYSRRMVRDERKRLLCVEAGKKGGNPTLKGRVKGRSKGRVNPSANRNPTPSSSFSSSLSLKEDNPTGLSGGPDPPPDKKPRSLDQQRRDSLFDVLVELTREDPKTSASHVGKVVTALLAAEPPYQPDEVRRLPEVLNQHFPDIPFTLGVVQKYIGFVRSPPMRVGSNGRPLPGQETAKDHRQQIRARLEGRPNDLA